MRTLLLEIFFALVFPSQHYPSEGAKNGQIGPVVAKLFGQQGRPLGTREPRREVALRSRENQPTISAEYQYFTVAYVRPPFSKSFSLIDCISVGVDRMQRNFEPMRKQVEAWQRSELVDVTAKVVIYEAFIEGGAVAADRPFPTRYTGLLQTS